MFQKELIDYLKSKLKEIKTNYELALEKNDPDGIHDLRVALKRLRAFFNLVEFITLDFKAQKNFRDFRKIARNTSGLRDSQVQQNLINKLRKILNLDVTDYETFLKKKEDDGIERFQNFSKKNNIEALKESRKIIKKALKNVTPVCAETKAEGRFYNLKNNLIILNSEENLGEEILHKVRILSKETHYTFEIVQQCFHLYEDRNDFISEIKKVHQILGNWHDLDVSLGYLNDFMQTDGKDPLTKPYYQLTQYITEEKERLRKKFRAVFDEFIHTADSF